MLPKQNADEIETLARREAREHSCMIAQGLIGRDEAVGQLADRTAIFGVAALIAQQSALPIGTVVAALVARADEPALVICRAAGLRTEAYSAVLRMRRRRFSKAADSPPEALAAYRRLPEDLAKRLLPFLRLGDPDAHAA